MKEKAYILETSWFMARMCIKMSVQIKKTLLACFLGKGPTPQAA